MITIDLTEEVIGIEPDSDIDILATIQTGAPDGCTHVLGVGWGQEIVPELANTSGILGAGLFRVSARHLKEAGKYEITSTTRAGKKRRVVIELTVFDDHLRITVLHDDSRSFWIYENLDPERLGTEAGSSLYFDSYFDFGDPLPKPEPEPEAPRPQTAWQHLDNDDYDDEGS